MMRLAYLIVSVGIFASAASAQGIVTGPPVASDGKPAISSAQAPVQSVNTQTGAVTVGGTVRATCTVSSFDASGNGSCTYGSWAGSTGFTVYPDCWATISGLSSSYVAAQTVITPGLSTVSINQQVGTKTLTISLGATTFWTPPPAGTTVTLACRGS